MKERTHSLVSFSTYLNKGFALRRHAAPMADARIDPEISPPSVFLALLHALVFRLPSFQQLDAELGHSYLQHGIGAERPFRDDTLRYSLGGFDLQPLERLLVDLNRRLKRSQAFDPGRVQGHWVAARDGMEVLSSFSRHGESCLERRVTHQDAAGRKVEETQYDHRAVGCQMIHSPVKSFLALEWLRPGEGEETAALRLLSRWPRLYGSRFFDLLLLDALYAQSPVLDLLQQTGWQAVISLKQNSRDLYQSAVGLFAHRPPDATFTEHPPAHGLSYGVTYLKYRHSCIRPGIRRGAGQFMRVLSRGQPAPAELPALPVEFSPARVFPPRRSQPGVTSVISLPLSRQRKSNKTTRVCATTFLSYTQPRPVVAVACRVG